MADVRCLFIGSRPDPARFVAPHHGEGRLPHKPAGGLWTCREIPGRAYSAWLAWCVGNGQTHLVKPGGQWRLVARDVTLLRIDSYLTFQLALQRYPYDPLGRLRGLDDDAYLDGLRGLDWPTLARDYDGVELTTRGLDATRYALPGLAGWDVPCILWLRWCFAAVERIDAPTGDIRQGV